jgi:hypothetical protein
MRACAILAFLVVFAATPASAESLIYRVDSATAVISGKHMIVTAKGAVKTGGWEKPHLIVKKSREAGDLDFEFVADPPEDSATVVQALMPVSVRYTTRLPKDDIAAVRVTAATNTVTAQIIPKTGPARPARKQRVAPH